jgi:hypothetical protein
VSSTAGLSLEAQPAAFTVSVKRTGFVAVIPFILAALELRISIYEF